MRVTISQEEFEAICFAEDLVNASIEAADDNYAHYASVHCYHLLSLIARLRDANHEDQELNNLYRLAKEMYPNKSPAIWKKLARKSLAIQKELKHLAQT